MALTQDQINAFRQTIKAGKGISYNGRSAWCEEQLDFIIHCEGVEEPLPPEVGQIASVAALEDAENDPPAGRESYESLKERAKARGMVIKGSPSRVSLEAFLQGVV